jgi:hypothetical protein
MISRHYAMNNPLGASSLPRVVLPVPRRRQLVQTVAQVQRASFQAALRWSELFRSR